MLALTDSQMNTIQKLAEPLVYADRAAYLARVAALLRDCPEIGDGVVGRAARQAALEFRRSPGLEVREHGGKYGR
jgi:hypothetical protein